MLYSFSFFVFTLNDLKQKMKVKGTKLLLRQRFNNKIGYTLCHKTHLVQLPYVKVAPSSGAGVRTLAIHGVGYFSILVTRESMG